MNYNPITIEVFGIGQGLQKKHALSFDWQGLTQMLPAILYMIFLKHINMAYQYTSSQNTSILPQLTHRCLRHAFYFYTIIIITLIYQFETS